MDVQSFLNNFLDESNKTVLFATMAVVLAVLILLIYLIRKRKKKKLEEKSIELSKLQEQSMKARMEYENTLLKESLEQSKKQYEMLNLELREIINKSTNQIRETVELLEAKIKIILESNQMLEKSIEEQMKPIEQIALKEIGSMKDNSQEVINGLNSMIQATYRKNLEELEFEVKKTIGELKELQESSQKRYKRYFNRKTIIDYLIYINLAITPAILIVLIYITVIKK